MLISTDKCIHQIVLCLHQLILYLHCYAYIKRDLCLHHMIYVFTAHSIMPTSTYSMTTSNGLMPTANNIMPTSTYSMTTSNGVMPTANSVMPTSNGNMPVEWYMPTSNYIVLTSNVICLHQMLVWLHHNIMSTVNIIITISTLMV